jgi:NCS1 family nucleobase:cation symporter-1
MNAADIGPVPAHEQTQSAWDLFLIFVGANIVATTFQVGASLASSFSVASAMTLIAVGSLAGAALVAALAPVGSRLRVPSIIAARAALGTRGAALVALFLYVSNFAWIAFNNVIAASASVRVVSAQPDARSEAVWAVALGLLATVIVWRGPRAVARADRIAVPLMLVVGVALTAACLRAVNAPVTRTATPLSWPRGLDVVVAYQVSWILMFADYPRYTRSPRGSAIAVFVALAITSMWMMPLGTLAARAAGSDDPGAMMDAVGLGAAGALLLTLATVTTNFVNIYMSALAWKSLVPRASETTAVWSIGLIGAALSAAPGVWLQQYASFMVILGAILVPVGGVLIAHFHQRAVTMDDRLVESLYDEHGPYGGGLIGGVVAWAAGALAFFAAGAIGGTLPALVVSMVVYRLAGLKGPRDESP